jgi:protein-L-isoaspartate(D-aspartate) O-methyltransferase
MARHSLARNGLGNVTVHDVTAAQGAQGWPAEGPFDVIVLSGSVAEVPAALLQQLKPGGRLVAIVGEEPVMRARLITCAGPAAFAQADLFDTVAPRLEGFAEASKFRF